MAEADLDLTNFKSNNFEMEWPKGSGKVASFPEIDRVAYMTPRLALSKILPGQAPIIGEALDRLGLSAGDDAPPHSQQMLFA